VGNAKDRVGGIDGVHYAPMFTLDDGTDLGEAFFLLTIVRPD
jgi:hypothetical protein